MNEKFGLGVLQSCFDSLRPHDRNENIKRVVFYAALTLLLTSLSFAEAPQAAKVSRIGLLFFGSRDQPHLPAFLQGLKDLGYVGRTNVAFEYRYAEGDSNCLPQLAAELVHLKVDVIVTTSNEGALAAIR